MISVLVIVSIGVGLGLVLGPIIQHNFPINEQDRLSLNISCGEEVSPYPIK